MEKLRVALNGTVVGTLEKHAGGALSFVYQVEWLEQTGSRYFRKDQRQLVEIVN